MAFKLNPKGAYLLIIKSAPLGFYGWAKTLQ